MMPAKIVIKGDYWDCQIYRHRLYLWTMNGSLKIIDWQKLVADLIVAETDNLAMMCAFTKGSYLYGSELKDIFNDDDVRNVLISKFEIIAKTFFEIRELDLAKYVINEQDNPFKELPIDSEFLNNRIYAITDGGLFSTNADKAKRRKSPVSSQLTKHWDCPLLSMSANKYAKISLSAGSEGLYQYNAANNFDGSDVNQGQITDERLSRISVSPSTFANYQTLSIYSSSNVGQSYLSLFKWDDNYNFFENATPKPRLVNERQIFENEIFNTSGNQLSWGSNEKIYKANNGGLDIVTFNNYAKEEENERLFSEIKHHPFQPWKGEIIGGGVAYFGTIIECENAVVVLLSDGNFVNIPGSTTRWRVYPRSINYENHLHVVFNDRLEIYSFNQDYFQDQSNKDFGFAYFNKQRGSF